MASTTSAYSACTDEDTGECCAPAGRTAPTLERLKEERGFPHQIQVDNGSVLISAEFFDWYDEHGMDVAYIQSSKPQQNGLVERFNGSFRREFLNAYLFETLTQVRGMSWLWQLDHNDERPHENLGNLPPSVYTGRHWKTLIWKCLTNGEVDKLTCQYRI